jgi:hypothetical protein
VLSTRISERISMIVKDLILVAAPDPSGSWKISGYCLREVRL